jgi:hypothetical protein
LLSKSFLLRADEGGRVRSVRISSTRALGVTIPLPLSGRADEIFE